MFRVTVLGVTVLEVGPTSVRLVAGQRSVRTVDAGLVRAALEWIDDPIGLYDDRPVVVADLWRTVMTTVTAGQCGSLLLVHPDGWSSHRIARVVAAANIVADEVVAVRRSEWRQTGGDAPAASPPARSRSQRTLVSVAAVGVVLIGVIGGVAVGLSTRPARWDANLVAIEQAATVVEGRIAVRLPRSWSITRVTGGPGSRRLQASSPADPNLAVHITQAYAPESELTQAAEILSREIAQQPAGVFVDFDAEATVGERPALTYREIRPGRVIEWTVLQAGSTRIGVGCQSPAGRSDDVHPVCVQAAISAQENGTDPPR